MQGDFLDVDLKPLYDKFNKKLRIVGNIPYNITSPIIFKMIYNYGLVEDSVLMMQDEVARRITAKERTKEYGILSVLVQYFSNVKYCFKVPPTVFYPKPKVSSAIIHINFKGKVDNAADIDIFIKTVKAAFGNRRKTLRNSLRNSIFGNCNLDNLGIDLSRRAEELKVEEFADLSRKLKEEYHG